ncbi:Mut7-C RNAse domain-containing protein [Microtetraspora malaysiensis]|uniref:Mut7-C RNAse domain-containing protein n=1 Tax=Microtetraspora malaysiensis TaxID=161358 RepID=UPI003D8C36E3
MTGRELSVTVAPELRLFLSSRLRRAEARAGSGETGGKAAGETTLPVPYDGTSSLGHVVESVGVPLTEVGALVVEGRPVPPAYRPAPGEAVRVLGVERPQRVPSSRFLLDVHLGTLARRLRVVGVDTAYRNDLDDDTLIERANAERRVLLTQDRGLLRRRALWLGAYVRGSRPDEQLADVLERFAPSLAPWTRCTACNGPLVATGKAEVVRRLPPGTRRTYETFARCPACHRVYWRGAHGDRLEEIIAMARRIV